jgi:hypothetical protein
MSLLLLLRPCPSAVSLQPVIPVTGSSFTTLGAGLFRSLLPLVMRTPGACYRLITSAPGVEPRTYGLWTAINAQFQEKMASQVYDEQRSIRFRRRRAHFVVADTLSLPEGCQVCIGAAQPFFEVSGIDEPHQVHMGHITYALVRDEPIMTDAARGGGR